MTGKQLKNSILQWAIQGKLVPQDPNDEPASALLERIREEKARLVKEKKIKKPKNESIIYRGDDNSHYEKFADGTVRCIDDEIPFEIPDSWCWCRIGDIFNHASGKQQSSLANKVGKPRQFITTSNLYWGYFDLSIVKTMNFTDEEIKNCSATKGDLLVCEGGAGYGRSAIWNEEYDICLQNHVHRLRPFIAGICDYIFFLLYYLKESNHLSSVGTAMPGLSANRLKDILVPLPPLSEQYSIVSQLQSVWPLIKKYDDLDVKLKNINISVKSHLKKSILQEAIQGKLVLQDSEDEPASVLLQRIKTEKERLIKEKKIKRDKQESIIFRGDDNCYYEQIGKDIHCIQDEIPFELPHSWEWARISSVLRLNPKNEAKYETKAAFIPMGKIDAGYGSSYSYDTVAWGTIRQVYTHFADGDVAFAKITPCFQNRKSAVFKDLPNGIGAGTTELRVLRPFVDTFDRFYLLYFLESPSFIDEAKFKGTANQQRIVVGYLENKLIPIPPLAEQRRIVAKIEQLFQMLK